MPHTPIDQNEINKAVWNACDTFRGTVDPSMYKDYILTMLFLKYISDVHQDKVEELQKEYGDSPELIAAMLESQSFKIPTDCSFWDLYKVRYEPGNGSRINKALHAIEEANIKLKGVFQDISFNSDKLGDEKSKNDVLRHLLEDFGKPTLNLRPSRVGTLDVIGNAYEFLIKNFAASSGKSAGEFYTPAEVSDLLAILLEPQEGDSICDPACGSGSLLMKCGKQVQKNNNGSKKYALYGQEAIGSTWALAKMNMFLHSEDNHRIEWGDTIRNPKLLDSNGGLLHFDVVTANPPFSLDKWGEEDAKSDHFGRFLRGVPPKTKGDYAFISHMIETLKPETGRMGVVVPHGVLFRGSSEGTIRQKLIEENEKERLSLLKAKQEQDKLVKSIKKDKNKIIAVGSHSYNKGYDRLLNIWKKIEEEQKEWELHIYGQWHQSTFIELAEKLQLQSVFFHRPIFLHSFQVQNMELRDALSYNCCAHNQDYNPAICLQIKQSSTCRQAISLLL